MSKEGKFLLYCIEAYKEAKRISGRQTYQLFKKHGVIEYVTEFFESLHTTGDLYIVADIDRYIANQKRAAQ